ncbi:hypothetical protein RB597_000794 [Gaeumannomyces tritici]
MAYTDDAVLAKLSALNESHDSIATAAQWIMFHRRHAERTVQLWLNRLKESPSGKRLNLVYLANEVTQQSKARHRDDFVHAFSPVMADAAATAYKGASADIQNKLRRVVDVWRDRNIFEPAIQSAVEARLDELDKARGASRAGTIGGVSSALSGSGSPLPAELNGLVAPHQSVSKQLLPTKSAVSSANQEYEKLTNPANPLPSPPVYAARLNGLLRTLATAEGAVAECVKARKELIGALESILTSNKEALDADEAQLAELSARKQSIDTKKNQVELAIMSGLSAHDDGSRSDRAGPDGADVGLARPKIEALTPPPGGEADDDVDADGAQFVPPPVKPPEEAAPATHVSPRQSPIVPQHTTPFQPSSAPGIEMLSNLASQYQSIPTNGSSNKRRRVETGEDFPDLGNDDGIDADVKEILRKDSISS